MGDRAHATSACVASARSRTFRSRAHSSALFAPQDVAIMPKGISTVMNRSNDRWCLIVRDGWGKNPVPAMEQRQRRLPRETSRRRPAAGRVSRARSSTPAASMSACPKARWATAKSATRTSARAASSIRNRSRSPSDSQRRVLRQRRDQRRRRQRARATEPTCTCSASSSDAGVHGLLEHLYGCLELCKRKGLSTACSLHAFTDGRDTSPNSGLGYVRQIEAKMAEIGVGRVATVSGRYWAMDRDNRWPRVEKAYRAIACGDGPQFRIGAEAVISTITITHRAEHAAATSSSRPR